MDTSSEMIKEIIAKQREYFYKGETKDIQFRIDSLIKLKAAIKNNEKLILEALHKDLKKSEFEAYSTEVGYSLDSIGYTIKNLKKWVKPKKKRTPIHQFGAKSYIYSEPYGVILIVGPFNYPFQLLIEPLIGAIAAGNCAILKPSESTPNVVEIVKKIIKETFKEEYIAVVPGERETTTSLINSKFDYIFFTGSVRVGKIVMEAAAKNLTPITLELGGKSPCIIDDTAKLNTAVKRIVWGKLLNVGQTCVAPDYFFVHSNIKKEFIDKLIETIESFYGKNPKESSDYGRIVNKSHLERLIAVITKDKEKIIFGGSYDKEDLYIEPTILDEVDFNAAVMEEELFGPIFPIIEYTNIDTVISYINSKEKPLALYIFTEDENIKDKFIKNTSFGGGCINDTISHVASPYIPFGGVGNSGIGAYHGEESFNVFSHKKSIMKKTTLFSINLIYPPYKEKLKLVKKILK